MPRLDISVNEIYGESEFSGNLNDKAIYNIVLLDDFPSHDTERYCYGEIRVPKNIIRNFSETTGIFTSINYTPYYKGFYLRIRVDNGDAEPEYFLNPSNNKEWFEIFRENAGQKEHIYICQYNQINKNGFYCLYLRNGYLALYSGEETDFTINAALKQNEIFLLKAFAGNLYQHPTTGVGLIDYLHGNFENSGLAAKLQEEFINDKMIINNAYMDSNTGELYLDVTEKDG